MRFFGIPLTRVDDLDTYFYGLVRSKTPRTIVTPNPEILLHAEQDQEFRSVLLLASDRLPDGIGLYLAEIMRESGLPRWLSIILMPYWGIRLLLGRRSIESKLGHRVQGSRLTEMLLNHAAREGWTVAILDRDASDWPEKLEAQHRAPAAIETKFPGVHIHYETVWTDPDWASVRQRLSDANATIVLSILGMKAQEEALLQLVPSVPNIRIAAGVGSSIDYHLGLETLAPMWVSRMGLEWLYRLIFSRRRRWNRIKRIMRAVFVFPWRALAWDDRDGWFSR